MDDGGPGSAGHWRPGLRAEGGEEASRSWITAAPVVPDAGGLTCGAEGGEEDCGGGRRRVPAASGWNRPAVRPDDNGGGWEERSGGSPRVPSAGCRCAYPGTQRGVMHSPERGRVLLPDLERPTAALATKEEWYPVELPCSICWRQTPRPRPRLTILSNSFPLYERGARSDGEGRPRSVFSGLEGSVLPFFFLLPADLASTCKFTLLSFMEIAIVWCCRKPRHQRVIDSISSSLGCRLLHDLI